VYDPERVLLRSCRFHAWKDGADFWLVLVGIAHKVDANRIVPEQDFRCVVEHASELPPYRFTF